jgi:hypothetical protein
MIASKVIADVARIKAILNVEDKYLDTTASITPSNTAIFVLLNGMSTGTSAITRNGQSIKSVALSGSCLWSINSAATTTFIRALIVCDRQTNGSAFAATDLLSNSASVLSQFNVSYEERFTILFDRVFTVSTGGPMSGICDVVCDCKTHTYYNTGTAGTIADIASNSLFLMVFSDQTTNTPSFAYSLRYLFVDN